MPTLYIDEDFDFPSRRNYGGRTSDPLRSLKVVEAVEEWAHERKKKIEEGMKKKEHEKGALTFLQYLIIFTTIGPWVLAFQGLMLYEFYQHFFK